MPSKKKKYNARFPAGRIKKIMQSDEEIGKVAQAVPVIISRTLELFVESLLNKTVKITNSRNAKTLSTSHMKQCIMAEQRFDFLRELVKNIPDISVAEEAANYNEEEGQSSPEEAQYPDSDTPYDLSLPSTSMRASRGTTSASMSITTTTPSNGSDHYQNGSGRAHLKRSSSVIKHHSTVEMPAAQSATMTTMPNQRYQRIGYNVRSNSNTESHSLSAPKRSATENPPQPHTAIPAAPIVSYDFFNKPVVKIDYSNIPLNATDATTQQSTTAPPHSAPADLASTHSSSSESPFNFNEGPIISIDLSNIVADSRSTSCNTGNTAVATISIGTLPPVVSATIDKTTTIHPVSTIPTNSNPASFTKTAMKNSATTLNAAVKSTFFELDEDYDNI